MVDPPELDGRRREDVRESIAAIAPNYTDEWDPEDDDAGSALVALFSELAEDVIERLDRLPEKHRASFFDELGFERRPPQPATVPVSFTVAPGAEGNVSVAPGTELLAPATENRAEQTFRVGPDDGFEATPARLREVYSVDPDADALYAHHDAVGDDAETTLFTGDDLQENALYVGHADLLTAGAGSTIRVDVETAAPPDVVRKGLVWEYWGEDSSGEEPTVGWHRFSGPRAWAVDWPPVQLLQAITLPATQVGTLTPSTSQVQVAKKLFRQLTVPAPTAVETGGPDVSFPAGRDWTADGLALDDVSGLFQGGRVPFPETTIPDLGSNEPETVTVSLEPRGPLLAREVDGVESKWIRCRVPDTRTPTGPLDVAVSRVALATAPTRLAPDMLLANDVPQEGAPPDAWIEPFGPEPASRDAFYVGSGEAFTKAGARVTLDFETQPASRTIANLGWELPTISEESAGFELSPQTRAMIAKAAARSQSTGAVGGRGRFGADGGDGGGPTLSWEYFDGDGWRRLPDVEDDTNALRKDGTVSFTVPDGLAATSVAGHDGHWIRARLVGGDYGDVVYVSESNGTERWHREVRGGPQKYASLTVSYELPDGKDPDHLVAANNREYDHDVSQRPTPYHPFRELPDDEQAVYLGFDAPLSDGPIQVLFALADHEYPEAFSPRVRWEYLADPAADRWEPLDGRDHTASLREQGIVSLVFPEETVAASRFGADRHWVRARVRGDAFGLDAPTDALESVVASRSAVGGRARCGEVVETAPPAGRPSQAPPTVTGIYQNTGRVSNVTVVEGERVGSSDGTPDQRFSVARPPVVGGEVWVDERTALSVTARERLADERPDAIEVETGPEGDVRAVWVRWERVTDFLDSGGDDRHYVLDRTTGAIRFGDGTAGRVPPHGRDNVRATYRTGGGDDGNVAAGAVTEFKSAVPFVDAVTNHVAGAGGAAAESNAAVLDRAPRTLRDRDRAVTKADIERLARDASRQLARVRCLPGMNRQGEREPGWVTLLVVPGDGRRKPTPSVPLRRQVERAVAERAPATLVADDRIEVRGPSYVAVWADADVVAGDVDSVSELESRLDARLSAYLHPLSGGDDGDGWPFGTLPTISDVYALLEGVDGVDHVASLAVHYESARTEVTVTEGETTPSVASDTLVHTGQHDVAVRLSGQRGSGRWS